MALGLTQPLTEMSTRNISRGVKGGRCVWLTTLPPSYVDCLEIWEPQLPGSLRASPGLQWDCFTSTLLLVQTVVHYSMWNWKISFYSGYFVTAVCMTKLVPNVQDTSLSHTTLQCLICPAEAETIRKFRSEICVNQVQK